MGRDAYALHDKKTIIFWSRKAGNTSLAEWIDRNLTVASHQSHERRSPRRLLKTGGILVESPAHALRLIQNEGYEDFILARNPSRRIVSAFVEKFVYYKEIPLDRLSRLPKFASNLFLEAMGRAGQPDQASDYASHYPGWSFIQFLEYLRATVHERSKNGEPNLNYHFNTQVPFCFDGVFTYKNIIRLESIKQEILPLAERLGFSPEFPHSRNNSPSGRQENDADLSETSSVDLIQAGIVPGPKSLLSPKALELIVETYEIDFRLLGYDLQEQPTPKKTPSHPIQLSLRRNKAKKSKAPSMRSFSCMLGTMNRYLTNLLNTQGEFQGAGLNLLEWSFLLLISEKQTLNRKVRKELGLTRQSEAELIEGLKTKGVITASANPSEFALTVEGEKRLAIVHGLFATQAETIQKSGKIFHKTTKTLRALTPLSVQK